MLKARINKPETIGLCEKFKLYQIDMQINSMWPETFKIDIPKVLHKLQSVTNPENNIVYGLNTIIWELNKYNFTKLPVEDVII